MKKKLIYAFATAVIPVPIQISNYSRYVLAVPVIFVYALVVVSILPAALQPLAPRLRPPLCAALQLSRRDGTAAARAAGH